MSAFSRPIIEAITAMILISWVPILVKMVETDVGAIGVVRLAVGYLCILLFEFLMKGNKPLPVWRKPLRASLVIIGALFGLHWITYFLSIKLSTPSIAAIGLSTYGIHLLIYGRVFLKERIRWLGAFSIGLAILGNLLVAPSLSLGDEITLGLLIGILSALFYALLPIYFKTHPGISMEEKAQGQFFFALIPFILISPWTDWHIAPQDWGWLLFMGVVCTGVGHSLWIRSSSVLPTELTSALFYVGVPSTMMFSALVLDERHEWSTLLGAFLIIMANLLVIFSDKIPRFKER